MNMEKKFQNEGSETQTRAHGCETQHSEKEVVLKEYFQDANIHTLC